MISKMPIKVYIRHPKFNFGLAYRAILVAVFSAFLFACSSNNITASPVATPTSSISFDVATENAVPSPTPSNLEDGCIPPLEGIAYSNRLNPSKPVPGKDLIVAPPPPWEMVSALPERWISWGGLFSRTVNGHVEIWIINGADWDKNPNNSLRTFVFLIYRPDTGEWKKVSAMVSDSDVAVGSLFTTKDGSLWGAVGALGVLPSPVAKSPLAKYNEQTEKFEFVNEASSIPSARTTQGPEFSFWNVTLQDAEGVFWILVQENGIYRFDPVTNQSEKYADTPNTEWRYTAISQDGYIYYLDSGNDLTFIDRINDLPVFRFDTKSKSIEQIGISLEPWPDYFSGMLVDDTNSLWLGGAGFRDASGNWYQIQRSPIFIVNYFEDHEIYRWKPPTILLESSDGRYWFNSLNGTAWLDLKQDKWCWFTTYKSNMVEDSKHNLWMVADGKLYKLPLGEQ